MIEPVDEVESRCFPNLSAAIAEFCPDIMVEPLSDAERAQLPEWMCQSIEIVVEGSDGVEINLGRHLVPAAWTEAQCIDFSSDKLLRFLASAPTG